MKRLTFREIGGLIDSGELLAAEAAARAWLTSRRNTPNVVGNVGAVFIDVGKYSQRQELVKEGVELTRKALADKATPSLKYNLANGLLELQAAVPSTALSVTADANLVEAYALYYEAIDESDGDQPEPKFNFAMALCQTGRAVEAADLVRDALSKSPEHGRGWATLGDVLRNIWAFYARYPDLLQDARTCYNLALKYEKKDQSFRGGVEERARATTKLLSEQKVKPHAGLSGHERVPGSLLTERNPWESTLTEFVWKAGLGLNLCAGCRAESPTAYDRYPLRNILADPAGDAYVRWAEVNVLVQGYSVARSLLWLSRSEGTKQVEVISAPVEGLRFSRRSGFLAAAFRESYGVLDRIAELLNSRLHISSLDLPFDKLFFEKRNKRLVFRESTTWPRSVGFRALLYLSTSFERSSGRFKDLRALRNTLQHSLVFHGRVESTKGWRWQTLTDDDLERNTLQMLQLVRAAIIYCCEGLQIIEHDSLLAAKARGDIVRVAGRTGVKRA